MTALSFLVVSDANWRSVSFSAIPAYSSDNYVAAYSILKYHG
ncbi:hypothetical protein [Burkholderia gladioli]|nr:hypothetical protein [Burkholderia gladioli]